MRMAVQARRVRDAKVFRRLEQSYLLQAEHSTGELERDGLLNLARSFGYAAEQIERRALVSKTLVICALAALVLFAVLYIP
ncbi:hypothetical protein [Bradyrhizobium iriomotense]|uniref:Uncharacterized protein n=1 Tax=Bradyrhizobium iriomotense TaxID=441950 RepID=A0ABQ6BC50_9BRAD|nr:hypothetical protein [Bradyrhizobium iriomotense]GLR91436.1 hypothetical protein GCM10007857_81530 [Bradyrhizobium iriomotense]